VAGIVVGNTNEASFLYNQPTSSWTTNINFSVTGNVQASGNVVADLFVGNGAAIYNVVAVTVQDPAQPNITSVGTLSSLTVTGNVTANYFIGNGSLLTNINANVDQLINGSYSVDLSSDGVLQYASVNDQQQALTGTTTTVYGNPYTIEADPTATVIIWTATSNAAVGFKMSVRTQVGNAALGGITNVELADIACASDGGTANISFVVSNRVKSNVAAPDTAFSVATNVNGNLIVRATNNDSQTEFYTHSVTEFNRT
jgi:hypothetical protein